MFDDLKPYPEYRSAAPVGWTHRRVKTLLTEVDRRSSTGIERLLSLRAKAGLVDHLAVGGKQIAPTALVNYKVVQPGELVMNRMRAATGVFGLADREGLVSPDYALFAVSPDVDPMYILALLRTPAMATEMRLRSRGMGTGDSGFLRLYSDAFGAMRLVLPSFNEQQAIVTYLAHAHQRINKAIASKGELLTLLAELRPALVEDALGHSSAATPRRLKTLLSRIEQGVSPQAEALLPGPDEWGVVKSGCVNHGVFRQTEAKRLPPNFIVPKELAIAVGDVLVSRASGSPRLVGSAARVRELTSNLILSDKIFRLVPDLAVVDPDYLVVALNSPSYRTQVRDAISGADGLANNLPLSRLREVRIPVYPLNEQRRIVASLAEDVAVIERQANLMSREIALLEEFRTRLTSDVVTGQVDVRHIAASLPPIDPTEAFASAPAAVGQEGEGETEIEEADVA